MAVRKTRTRKTARKAPLKKGKGKRMPVSAAFWTFLLIVIIIAFFMLLPKIKSLSLTQKTAEPEQQQEQVTENGEDEGKGKREQETVTEGKKTQNKKPAEPAVKPQEQPEKKPQTEKPAAPAQPSTPPSTPTAPVSAPPVKPVETRDRNIFLIQEATMMPVQVNRKLNVSNTPLLDSINALLTGPTADEKRSGKISLVPEGSKLLSARVDGSTAVLDFNQEFRYNTRGSEGCAAQVKQIVWTATEFPNIKDVQFLIEGQRVDFLSEGVVISSPIGR